MHLLIADDNPLSLQFLREAALQLGHSCAEAADGETALSRAQAEQFDLLLLDLRMPGLGGLAVLQRLRASPQAASRAARALATTAETDPALRTRLQTAGFDGVLAKPLDITTLQRALGPTGVAEPAAPYLARVETAALLDDALALRNLGSADSVHALRRLFRLELEALPAEISAMLERGDTAALSGRLHKLCASAGFCGAPRLDQACRELRRNIDGGALSAQELRTLLEAAAATLQAL